MNEDRSPPLGVMPKWRHLELRGIELSDSISRYLNTSNKGYSKMKEWVEELNDIISQLNVHRDRFGKQEFHSETEKELIGVVKALQPIWESIKGRKPRRGFSGDRDESLKGSGLDDSVY